MVDPLHGAEPPQPPSWAVWALTVLAVLAVVGAILAPTLWSWLVAASFVFTATALWLRRRDAERRS